MSRDHLRARPYHRVLAVKILFLTDNYPPEVNAPATRTHFHCREWVRAGADVTVVTCAPNFPQGKVYEGYVNRLIQREWMDGVQVVRVWSYMAPNAGFARRVVDYLSFAGTGTIAGLYFDCDVVLATSPQFFTALAGASVAHLRGRPWVFEIRDLWPESIVAAGGMRRGWVFRVLERLEMALYRSADLLVPVTDAFRRQLEARGISGRKIRVITNGVDLDAVTPVAGAGWRPDEGRPFRVGYLGTHGMAHGLDLVLHAAELVDRDAVEFILVGDGADKQRLVDEARGRRLANVRFLEPVSRDEVRDVLAGFDACLVPLRDSATFRSVIPSKIFEAAAAKRPILLGVRGEAQGIVEAHGAGLCFRPEDPHELLACIDRLRSDWALYQRLQEGGEQLARTYDRRALALEMLDKISALDVGGRRPAPLR